MAEERENTMVSIQDVHKRFGCLDVLRGVTLDVAKGEVVVILGPSGSGKSTLLRLVSHLDRIDSGRIYVDGRMVGYEERSGKLSSKMLERRCSKCFSTISFSFPLVPAPPFDVR